MRDKNWRRANHALLAAIILINGYIILIPLLPMFTYWWQQNHGDTQQQLTERLSATSHSDDTTDSSTTFHAGPQADGLVIPKMLLDTPLVEGPMSDSFNLLKQGAWRLPISTTPDEGGNTVIAGHRFSYTGPRGVFYYMNKLSKGDEIGLWYGGKLYRYTVESSRTVKATEVSVQQPTTDTRLTLYTCTPLWNPVDRLVIVAKPQGANS
jgi:LPXTG-site transpeptidase (sortase) family protein